MWVAAVAVIVAIDVEIGGRNRLCADAFAAAQREGNPKTLDEIEAEILNGQSLQGTLTAKEVNHILKVRFNKNENEKKTDVELMVLCIFVIVLGQRLDPRIPILHTSVQHCLRGPPSRDYRHHRLRSVKLLQSLRAGWNTLQ